ncbi:MAG: hypothetical protein SNH80_05535 [Rikenellaceae bacterium]
MLLVVISSMRSEYRGIIALGFILRLLLLFVDYYHIFPIPNSGGDTEKFHWTSVANVTSLSELVHTNYTIFLTYVYKLTSCSRLIAQFINVLFGMGVLLLINDAMRLLQVDKVNFKKVILVLALMPNLCALSAILLREAWVEFFVALSVYFFVRWFISGNVLYIAFVTASVLAASYMHAGVIGLLMGYGIAFISYSQSSQSISFSGTTIMSIFAMLAIGFALSAHLDLFTGKLAQYDGLDDIVDVTNAKSRGGDGSSDYLTWVSVDSVTMSLMFAPLKMFYFLFSPLPTEWRGIRDIFGFSIDGAIYMWLCYNIWRNKASSKVTAQLKKFLIAAMLVVVFIFAYGTRNAGTALRHRAKILPVIVMTFAICTLKKEEKA